jgi:hypothetical protein
MMKPYRQEAMPWKLSVLAVALGLAAASYLTLAGTQPARATVPGALALADKLLTSPDAIEDESPYNMIDAIGPNGITQQQAVEEVTSKTMMGGLPAPGSSSINPYGGGS